MSERRLGRGLGALLSEPLDVGPEDQAEIELDRIEPNPYQPRRSFDDDGLEELRASIETHGVLQPIVVRRFGDDYQLISGERRWRAARRAGLEAIPAVVREGVSDDQMLELALVENVQRRDLDPIERAVGFRRLMHALQLTQEQVAARVGLRRATVTNHLRLLDLPDGIQADLIHGRLSMGHARALLGLERPDEQLALAREAAEKDFSVRKVERLVRQRRSGSVRRQETTAAGSEAQPAAEPWVLSLEDRLREALGTKVGVDNGNGYRGRIVIEYFGREDLERLIETLAPRKTL